MDPTFISTISCVIALFALLIATWTAYRQVNQDKVKLFVDVRWGMASHNPSVQFLSISVMNRSRFPITLSEVGLFINDDQSRFIHPDALTIANQRLPVRMEPRTSISVHFPPDFLASPGLENASCAYASTECGYTKKSSPNVVQQMINSNRGNSE